MPRSFHSAVQVPVIETARLKLRGHRLDDFTPCAAMWADPVVTRHIGGRPLSEEESWTRLLRYVGHWALLGFGYWVASYVSNQVRWRGQIYNLLQDGSRLVDCAGKAGALRHPLRTAGPYLRAHPKLHPPL